MSRVMDVMVARRYRYLHTLAAIRRGNVILRDEAAEWGLAGGLPTTDVYCDLIATGCSPEDATSAILLAGQAR
jgi:hypothetical protein